MSQRKTLGGDRLGTGRKNQVDTKTFNRSTHDTGYVWRSTMSAGTLVPFMCQPVLPGDTLDINLGCEVLTLPTLGPLFGSMKVQLDVFTCPVRLYQGKLHNNALGIGLNMANVKLPQVRIDVPVWSEARILDIINKGDLDNAHTNPSSIFSYLGIRGFGIPSQASGECTRDFNAVGWLSYWDVVKNYYANKQEDLGWVIHTTPKTVVQDVVELTNDSVPVAEWPATPTAVNFANQIQITTATQLDPSIIMLGLIIEGSWNGTEWQLEWVNLQDCVTTQVNSTTDFQGLFNTSKYGNRSLYTWRYINDTDVIQQEIDLVPYELENLDTMRNAIIQHIGNDPFIISEATTTIAPYSLVFEKSAAQRAILGSQEGLAVRTYMSDLFNNWLNTEYIDGENGIAAVTAVSTEGDEFTIDALILHKKVYEMLNDIMVSGGTYDDWQQVVYDHEGIRKAGSPIYWGSLIKELQFQEVVSNAESDAGNGVQPLGTLAGRGRLGEKHKGGNITVKVDEISYLLGIVSIVPRLDYSQGNEWHMSLETMDDFHKPHMDEIGFQELITEQMAWWDGAFDTEGGRFTRSAGKQPAWLNYMTDVNKVKGNFAIQNNSMFMVLTRRYQPKQIVDRLVTIEDLTTYVDPRHFNHIFAQTSLDSQNYWVQIGVDMTTRRKISARLMPNL